MGATRRTLVPILVLLLVAPTLASGATTTATMQDRVVARSLATPAPLGPILLLADDARWRVDVPAEAVVQVTARGAAGSLFLLGRHAAGAAPADPEIPTSYGVLLLPPGSWIVRVDPFAGAPFRADVRFEGFVVDVGGAPAAFTLTDLRNDRACVLPGACLP